MTYLIAVRSGFNKKDANLLAYSSQYIDNNDHIFNISPGPDNKNANQILDSALESNNLYKIGLAVHKPDIPNLAWDDDRLCSFNCKRNNKKIFLINSSRVLPQALNYCF